MSCSFCIIPSTRGRQTSRGVERIVAEAKGLVGGGTQEIVITGVQISAYRSDQSRLYDLVRELLKNTRVGRLRLTSIAPWDFDLRLLDFFGEESPRSLDGTNHPRLCRHFHLSLQSGCASTLRRMRRPYSPRDFRQLVSTIRTLVPGVAITTDIIVGFPGETDEEFEDSLAFAEDCRFARIHAFPYSPRPGTAAVDYPNQVPHLVKKERMSSMLNLAAESLERFAAYGLDRQVQILWERQREGRWIGTTDNYLQVSSNSVRNLSGQLSSVGSEHISVVHTRRAKKTSLVMAPNQTVTKEMSLPSL